MRKNFKIILDCDDVLLDCNQYALNILNSAYHTKYTLEDITDWGKLGTDIDRRLCLFQDKRFVRDIPPIEGAEKFVEALMTKGEVFICTSVDVSCIGERISSIIKHFPMLPPENILIGARKDLLQGDVILDDGYHNLKNSNVKYPVLFRRPWNHSITGICSVSTYDDFLELIDIIKKGTDLTETKKIIALVGPSGSGKSTIAKALINDTDGFSPVISYTTRKQRNIDDCYHFISKKEFLEKKESGYFFETSSYQGEYYGIHVGDIFSVIKSGKTAVLVLDVNGAIALKHSYKESVLTVYVKREKDSCIRSILNRNLSQDETVRRIVSMDAETSNEELCDITVKNDGTIQETIKQIMDVLI